MRLTRRTENFEAWRHAHISFVLIGMIGFAFMINLGCDSAKPVDSASKQIDPAAKDSKTDSKTDSKSDSKSNSRTNSEAASSQSSSDANISVANSNSGSDFANGEYDWPQYRGVDNSTQNSPELPTQWSDEEGILWKAELPGRGSSSPIVVGNRVFVTAYAGYGISAEERGALGHLRFHLFCKDRETGATIWQRKIKGSMLTQRLQETLLGHGFASNTPVSDGENVYVFCGTSGLFAFDMDGELVWEQNVGAQSYFFGSSASPVIYEDLLIVNASIENKTIYAFNKKTGVGVWKIDNIDRSYSMPVFGQAPDGSTEMVVSEEDLVHGYDPKTGEELWTCEGVHNYIIAVPPLRDGVVYINGGLERQMMAIKLGGRGDVTESHKVWEVQMGGNVCSPVLHNGVLFVADDNGIMGSYESATGKRIKKARTGTKTRVYASPFVANDQMYIPLQDEGVLIVEANSGMKEVRRNKIDSDTAPLHASLAANGDRFYVRTDGFLYCIGKNSNPANVVKYSAIENVREMVLPVPRLDFVSATNRLQQYCYYLATDPVAVESLLIVPYKSVITEEQALESRGIIKENFERFDELRSMQDEAFWIYMKGELDKDALLEKLAVVDKDTIKHSSQVRVLIKKLFSKEQMDQHMKDAAEWQRKQKEKQQNKKK